MTTPAPSSTGLVLTELLIAALISSILMLGLVQMAAGTSRSLHLIESLSDAQQGGRFAIDQVRDAAMAAGYVPAPWARSGAVPDGLDESVDGGPGHSDVLTVAHLSDRNCYDTFNPVHDGEGRPAYFLRESTFERTAAGNLAHTCHYGPEGGTRVRQINREGLVRRVESFQVLYAEDLDGDGYADRRVRAGQWQDARQVLGIQLGVLVATEEPVGDHTTQPLAVLDEAVAPPADGRLRRVWATTFAMISKPR